MILEVRDPVLAEVARRTATAVPGVARLHELPWGTSALVRSRSRGVEIDRAGATPVLTVRVVAVRGHVVLDVLRTVQRSVREEVRHITGLEVEVVALVVDLD